MGTVVGGAAALLLGATGLALAAMLRLRSPVELLLAAALIAFAEVVTLVLVLSPFAAVRRPLLLLALTALAALAVGAWARDRRPRPSVPSLRLLASPPVVALATVVALALAYVVALALGTAPNAVDSLVYHLPRAALWRQQGAVGYLGDPYDQRLNANPPNAEIALTFMLELTRDERFASLVQFVAALVCAGCVFALARRVGLARSEAAFGALLFLTLPVVLLQSATTLNDLVVAAPLLLATVFLLGDTRPHLGLAGLATAMALGTKVTAVFAVPLLFAVAFVAVPRSARWARFAAIASGAAVGSFWYVVNLIETGELLGQRADSGLIALGELRENLLAGFARVLDLFELPGAEGVTRWVVPGLLSSDVLFYVFAALVLLVALLGARTPPRTAALGAGLALLPLCIPPVSYVLWRVFARLHAALGGTGRLLPAGEWPPQTVASDTLSWFGPIGLLLVVGAGVGGFVLYRRGPSLVAIVLAAAPAVWLVLFSLAIHYDPLQGRFFLFPLALSASVWGIALRTSAVGYAIVAIAATTMTLTLASSLEKPSGVEFVADRHATSVWGKARWEVQSALRARQGPVLRFLEERVPSDATVALSLGEDDLGQPAFGRHLEREVALVDARQRAPAAEWLVANPDRAPEVDPRCWRPVFTTADGWRIFRALPGCDG